MLLLQQEQPSFKIAGVMPRSQSFPRAHRLTKGSDFERVYRAGKLIQNEHFRIFVQERAGNLPPRLGLSLMKRLGKASVRNRIKRWIREWFRACHEQLPGADWVIQPKAASARLAHKDLRVSLEKLVASWKIRDSSGAQN